MFKYLLWKKKHVLDDFKMNHALSHIIAVDTNKLLSAVDKNE